jgi:superfamily I DNA and/or RNA helicase
MVRRFVLLRLLSKIFSSLFIYFLEVLTLLYFSIIAEKIQKKMKNIERMRSLQQTNTTAVVGGMNTMENLETEIQKLESSLLMELNELKDYKVDPSILKTTGIGKLLVQLVKKCKSSSAPSADSTNFISVAEQLIEKWRILVREYSNTVKNLKGGNIIKIPPMNEITIPVGLSTRLWKTLKEKYNESQLFAIKYVVDQFEKQQDTRIALVQGPPGTGKTSTIIGIVSALLNHAGFGLPNQSTSSAVTNFQQQRLLICAPSNAAIDEILTRLSLFGIYNHDGQLVNNQLRIVRLGEPPGSSDSVNYSPLIHSLTLDHQIELKMQTEDLYIKSLQTQELLSSLEQQSNEIQSQIRLCRFSNAANVSQQMKQYEEKLKTVKYQLYEIRNQKILYEISLERLKNKIRSQLLLEANVVGTTLSSSGKQQFLDYIIKENVFFTTTIIDEAAQTTEPSTLIPLRFGCKRLVLVGDPRQLPATVLSRKAERFGLARSLFERLERAEHDVVMLTIQYRMHPGM